MTQPGSSRGEAALGDLPRSGKSGGEQLELKGSRSDLLVNRSKCFTVTPCESKHHGLQSSGWPGPGFPALPGAPEVHISLLLLPLDFSASSPPVPREQSLREPLGVRLLHLPAAHLDRHCQEELCHAGGAVLGLGACHHCHGHQQVGLALSPNTAWLCVLAPALTSRVSPCSVGGLILDRTVSDPNFAGMAVFTPVINGESWGCSSWQTVELSGVSGRLRAIILFWDAGGTQVWLPPCHPVTDRPGRLFPKKTPFQGLLHFLNSSRLVEHPHLPKCFPCGNWQHKDLYLHLGVRRSH